MKNKQTLILILVLIVLILLSAGVIGYTIYSSKKVEQEVGNQNTVDEEMQEEQQEPIIIEEKEIEIFKRK